MYKDRSIMAVIPARGGSKGIPHKNIVELCGKPLIAYSIDAALSSKYIDYVMVSTDDPEIATVAKEYGADIPFMRPKELATDTSKTIDAVLHSIITLKEMGRYYSDLILLQPTEPLRTHEDIDRAIEVYYRNACSPLVSVNEVDDHPILIRTIKDDRLSPLLNTLSTCRRQDMPDYYRVNGCIYINAIDDIDENTSFNDNPVPYVMERSHSVDIDELSDLAMANYYLNRRSIR